MTATSIMRAVICAASIAGVGMLAFAAPASAECKKQYQSAKATGLFRGVTALEARADWRLAVLGKDGLTYALWYNSKDRSTTCKQGTNWTCVARAKACN
jgi:hypothetical protein